MSFLPHHRLFHRTTSRRQKGFSLTELSIAIAIIAVIAGSALSVALTNDFYANTTQTNAKLDKIEEALASFLVINQRLPCPADGTQSITSESFGIESTPSVSGCGTANFTSGNVYAGVIPTRTLQLPDEFMLDAWGRRITYAVDFRFANNVLTNNNCDGTSSPICFIDTIANDASITVQDSSGAARTTQAIYVLISHGENGHGAFTKNGGTTRLNAYSGNNPWRNGKFPSELENAHYSNEGSNTSYNTSFVSKQYQRDEANLSEYFDDMVRFRTKHSLIKAAGSGISNKILYDSICRDANAILSSPTNACTGANNESDCTNFANEIYKRCL
jgi:prepilin-type N-terminal cleavage/methylation domain-containing protein